MTDKEIIIHGEQVPVITLTRHQLEEDWYTLHQQLQRKEQECEKLRQANDEKNEFLQKLGISATGEFHRIKYYIDKLHQECEELKKREKYLYNFLTNKYNYGTFRPMWGAYLLKHLFNENLGNFFDEKAYEMTNTIEKKDKEISRYKQALEKIEEFCITYSDNHDAYETVYKHKHNQRGKR